MDSSPLSSGLLPFSFLFLFCFVYRTNTCMSYRINQLDKIWKVVVLLLYFFFCYLVNIKKSLETLLGFFLNSFFACFISWQRYVDYKRVNMDSRHGKVQLFAASIVLFYSSQNSPPLSIWIASVADTSPCQSLLVFSRFSTLKSLKCVHNDNVQYYWKEVDRRK